MTAINTVIFDLGGVLIDWNPRYLYRQIFEKESEMEWFLENVCTMAWNEEQDAGRTWLEATAMKVLEFPSYAEPIKAYHSRWKEMLNGPIEESVKLLKSLKKRDDLRLYALTNWSAETFHIARQEYDFLQLFEGIVVSGEEKTRKPFPEIYQILMSRYDVHPAQALFIDDNAHNVQTGTSLGIDSIHFQSSRQLAKELQQRQLIS